jgi:hypothetical protein
MNVRLMMGTKEISLVTKRCKVMGEEVLYALSRHTLMELRSTGPAFVLALNALVVSTHRARGGS